MKQMKVKGCFYLSHMMKVGQFMQMVKRNLIKKYTYNIDKKIIGMRLKEFRKEKNITQEELASTLNTTHSTISAYESGKTTILTAFAYEICKRYNISMDYLCGRTRQINYLVFIYNRKNYRHKSIAYINILILETTGSKILLKTLDFKSK